jgi:hypothetical protein
MHPLPQQLGLYPSVLSIFVPAAAIRHPTNQPSNFKFFSLRNCREDPYGTDIIKSPILHDESAIFECASRRRRKSREDY